MLDGEEFAVLRWGESVLRVVPNPRGAGEGHTRHWKGGEGGKVDGPRSGRLLEAI